VWVKFMMRATPKIRENPIASRASTLPLIRPLMMMSIRRPIITSYIISVGTREGPPLEA
jgi:hypothetical protein